MNAGVDPEPWLGEADAVLVIDSLAPWSPDLHRPRADCRVVQLGPDPLYSRFPVRHFATDVAIAGETADGVLTLAAAMRRRADGQTAAARAKRRARITARCAAIREAAVRSAGRGGGSPPSKAFVSHCLAAALGEREATILSELGCPMAPLRLRSPASWYQEPHSGGLGWSFPAGLGMQLANRERLVVATMGDGSYIFANPVACHQIAEALALPILVIVLNNAEWGAVRQSVLGLYPDGQAARANRMPLTGLSPSPDFTRIAAASRAWVATVDDGQDLTDVLRAAFRHIDETRTQAFVEIRVAA